MEKRCILCSRKFVVEDMSERDDDDELFTTEPRKPSSVCQICAAKLKNEADKNKKPTKPVG